MYVLPLESVYGVFGGAGQRLVEVGVVGVVEEGTTGAVVVSGGTGVVVGPTDVGPTGVGPPGVDSTGPTGVDWTGADPTGVDDATSVVDTPGVVDTMAVVDPTDAVGSTGLVARLVPMLVSTTTEPGEFVIVTRVVKIVGFVD